MKDKIYRIVIELMVLSLCMFLVGCKNTEEQEKVKEPIVDIQENVIDDEIQDEVLIEGEEYSMKVTMEYVCSEFGMSELDFDGIDFEDFVNEYNLTYESIQRENIKVLLRCYKEDYGKIKIPDYRDIFKYVGTATLTKENQDEISIVFFSRIEGEEHFFYIFDFEIGKIIVGSGSEANVCEDDIVGEADGNVKSAVIALFEQYNIYSWRTRKANASTNKDIMGTTGSWSLDIKFEDATIYGIHGNGLTDETAPENLDLFVQDLKALATSAGNPN